MAGLILQIPLGPSVALYPGEFLAIARHRFMLFFYFGLACTIMLGSSGKTDVITAPEIRLGIAAVEVGVGLTVLILLQRIESWRALRAGRLPRINIGLLLIAVVGSAIMTSELVKPVLIGAHPSNLLQIVLKSVFYLVLTETLTSVMMQTTLPLILAELRMTRDTAPDSAASPRSKR